MDVTAMLPRRRSRAERALEQLMAAEQAMLHPRAARSGLRARAAMSSLGAGPRRRMASLAAGSRRRAPRGAAARSAARRAALESWTAARTARALPLGTLAETAWVAAGRPQRRRRGGRAAMVLGVAGAGAAAAWMASRRRQAHGGEMGGEGVTEAGRPEGDEQLRDKPARVPTTPQEGHPAGTGERTDRDIGGPTAPDEPRPGATGGAPGTPPGSGFEPHS